MLTDYINNIKNISYIDFNNLKDKTVYITGATGLIGSNLVKTILTCCDSVKVVVQIRNKEKALKLFGDTVEYVVCDLLNKPEYNGNVDYIIHCANPTSSKFFVKNPVETINTAVNGTFNILEFARKHNVDSFIFLSTMEVYGTPSKGTRITESQVGSFDPSVVRNSYPLSKELCENLCVSYFNEYNVKTKVLRLTQTFGPGIDYNDGRVFAEFARCAIENRDIVLKTKGETERDYLYITDAVTAILTVLTKGSNGEIYTAANEDTYCSIYEMANLVASMYDIKVVIEEQDITKSGYANTLYMDLDTSKLQSLGWKPSVGLEDSYRTLIEYMKSNK